MHFLRIRDEQMLTFRRSAEERLTNRIIERLRRCHGASIAGLSEGALRQRIAYGIRRAERHGLTWVSSITTFVVLMFVFAPHFDEHPEIHRRLTEGRAPADRRIAALLKRTHPTAWDEISRRRASDAWPTGAAGAALPDQG